MQGVILGTKQLKYYFKFMKMTDIDDYIKKTLKILHKNLGNLYFLLNP